LDKYIIILVELSVRSAVGEETSHDDDLRDGTDDDKEGFTNGPGEHPGVEVFRPLATLRLSQSVVSLVVSHTIQTFVNFLRRGFHLEKVI
jgi:hypothetical protein